MQALTPKALRSSDVGGGCIAIASFKDESAVRDNVDNDADQVSIRDGLE